MQEFTGWEYLAIDVANNSPFGLDKKDFESRIEWVKENHFELEDVAVGQEWKEKPLYLKAVSAIRKAEAGKPTGHLVGFDAVCSGMQIMSVLTGCAAGAYATGLVDPNRRADAYTDCTNAMSTILGYHVPGERDKVKTAAMTVLYGSKKEPIKVFGEDTPELAAFYQAMYQVAPGACDLLPILVNSWKPYSPIHSWTMPDGFDVQEKVKVQCEAKIEVDELNHSTFEYIWYENMGTETGVKNAADVVHSVDAYILRSLVRRCSYDLEITANAFNCITDEIIERQLGMIEEEDEHASEEVGYFVAQYERSTVADLAIIPYLERDTVGSLTDEHLAALRKILSSMVDHDPFDVVTIHDQFSCHANHMNHLRKHYRNILAEIADSNLLDDLLTQLYGRPASFVKKSTDLSKHIYNSNYALC